MISHLEIHEHLEKLRTQLEQAITQRDEALDMVLTLSRTGEPYPQSAELWRKIGGGRLMLVRRAEQLDKEVAE